MITANNFW